jgi:hypothetical protein
LPAPGSPPMPVFMLCLACLQQSILTSAQPLQHVQHILVLHLCPFDFTCSCTSSLIPLLYAAHLPSCALTLCLHFAKPYIKEALSQLSLPRILFPDTLTLSASLDTKYLLVSDGSSLFYDWDQR